MEAKTTEKSYREFFRLANQAWAGSLLPFSSLDTRSPCPAQISEQQGALLSPQETATQLRLPAQIVCDTSLKAKEILLGTSGAGTQAHSNVGICFISTDIFYFSSFFLNFPKGETMQQLSKCRLRVRAVSLWQLPGSM